MGLAISFAGVAYLVWVVGVGVGRHLVNELSRTVHAGEFTFDSLPGATKWLCRTFLYTAPVFDIIGVLWLLLSLALIVGASRQRWSISWPWMSGLCQAMAAALITAWAGLSGQAPFIYGTFHMGKPPYPTAGWTFMSVAVCLALASWVGALVWLLYERARLGRGPSLRDGLRTHVPG